MLQPVAKEFKELMNSCLIDTSGIYDLFHLEFYYLCF